MLVPHGEDLTIALLGVSRFSLYDWQRRAKRAAAGEGDSPTSGPDPTDTS